MYNDSILELVKKVLNVPTDYDVFDIDIITHINRAFYTLMQLGVGPVGGFSINDEKDVWTTFSDDTILLSIVKPYVCLKTRLTFDPPTTSFAIQAIQDQIQELEWRLNIHNDFPRTVANVE